MRFNVAFFKKINMPTLVTMQVPYGAADVNEDIVIPAGH